MDSLRGERLAGFGDELRAVREVQERLGGFGLEQFTFAWAGKAERGKSHYYRVQGPEFLVEFENAQPGGVLPGEGNHIHTVWRDPENDFGDDLLLRHYAQEHLPYVVTRMQSSMP